jgi:NitT/TauT family transport system substrate-binding protein
MSLDRRDFIAHAAGATFGAAAGLSGVASAQDLHKVHVLEVPTDGAKSCLYAQKAGLFRKRGIDADIVAMGSGAAIYAAVIGGSADFGSGSLWPAFEAYAHGVPLRIIAPASIYASTHPDGFLLVRKDSPIKTPADLNGKIVGGDSAKDVSIIALRAWMDQHGADGKSIKPLELKQTQQLEALDLGRIDAVTLKPPYLTVATASGKFRVLGKPYDAIAPRFLLSCWVATADYIAKNPDIVKNFVAALSEAARYTSAHEAETIDMVAAFSGQDPAQLAQGLRSTTAETATLPMMQVMLDAAVKYGVMDQGFDLKGILAPQFPLSRS